MTGQPGNPLTIGDEAMQCAMICGLKRALDLSYKRVLGAAKLEWERRFAGNDPSNACVRVRIEVDTPPVRGSAFLARPQSRHRINGRTFPFPRLAR